nr:hypothetical protein [Pseudomonas aeruginosa]
MQSQNTANSRAEKRRAELVDAAIGRLHVESALDLSDAELNRCLGNCVCPDMLIRLMQEEREKGRTIPPHMMSQDVVDGFLRAGKPLPTWALNQVGPE